MEGSRNHGITYEDVVITDSPEFTVEPNDNSFNLRRASNTTMQDPRNIHMQQGEDFSPDSSVVKISSTIECETQRLVGRTSPKLQLFRLCNQRASYLG